MKIGKVFQVAYILIILAFIVLFGHLFLNIPKLLVNLALFVGGPTLYLMACGFTGWLLSLWQVAEDTRMKLDLVTFGTCGFLVSEVIGFLLFYFLTAVFNLVAVHALLITVLITIVLVVVAIYIQFEKYW